MGSKNQCQKCNKSPWYDTDGQRCVCGPDTGDWFYKYQCRACGDESESVEATALLTDCPWATKCVNSKNQCQKCNKGPWYDTDGQRCVCGPDTGDWIHKDQCTACDGEAEV